MSERSPQLRAACRLAEEIYEHGTVDFADFAKRHDLPDRAHGWPEIQTVLHAHRMGRPVTPSPRVGRQPNRTTGRANMFEPDTDDFDADLGGDLDTDGDDGLDAAEFSYAEIRITRTARDAFDDTDTALCILVGCAVRHGDYRPGRNGSHIVTFREHSFILSADGRTVIAYATRTGRNRPNTSSGGERSDARFAIETFDPAAVVILPRVLEGFANKHGSDLDEADTEIRDYLRWATAAGKHQTLANGCGLFQMRGFRVWVSPDGTTVTKYRTEHIERTPGDVRDGVPSRFRRNRRRS